MPVIWAHKGVYAGTIVAVDTQAEADKAEADGWGQDMSKYAGHQFIVHELDPPPELNNELPPEPEAEAASEVDAEPRRAGDDGGQYQTRHLEAEPPRRGRPPKAKE